MPGELDDVGGFVADGTGDCTPVDWGIPVAPEVILTMLLLVALKRDWAMPI